MVYCRVSNKVRFFIYNIYTINQKKYKNKYKNTKIYIKIDNNNNNNNNNNKYRVYTYLQLCLLCKIPYVKGVSSHYD